MPVYALNALAIALLMMLVWLASLRLRDVSIVDIFWGAGFVLVSWLTLCWSETYSPRGWLLTGMVSVWGIRLTAYLGWRKIGKAEDFRYAAMRERWGERFPLVSLFVVFGLQGAILWIVALPIQAGVPVAAPLTWVDAVGVLIWWIGLLFESVGDWQLARFKSDPANRGRVMDRGVWRYTRHPNYFGDFLVWWGIFLVAWSGTGSIWLVISPLLMSYLLMRVSGVKLLEATLRRREGYAEYVRRTNAFFPGPPRRGPPRQGPAS